MHLRQQHAAGRHPHRVAAPGAQKLRRQPGIFGRRQPHIEARQRPPPRPPANSGDKRARHPVAPIGAGVDRAEQQQDRQHRAHAPRIAPRQAGSRPADAQPAGRRRHAVAVRRPQRAGAAVKRGARPSASASAGGEADRSPARCAGAPRCGRAMRRSPRLAAPRHRRDKGERKCAERRGMDDAGSSGNTSNSATTAKTAEDAQGRPGRRPARAPTAAPRAPIAGARSTDATVAADRSCSPSARPPDPQYRRASRARRRAPASLRSSAAPGSPRSALPPPAPRAPAGGCCKSSSSPRHRRRHWSAPPDRPRPSGGRSRSTAKVSPVSHTGPTTSAGLTHRARHRAAATGTISCQASYSAGRIRSFIAASSTTNRLVAPSLT